MYLKYLHLYQFKNHKESKFTFDNRVICFTGNNGAGKTNILDALHYLSQTKSYFNYIDSQNIQFNEEYFMLKGVFSKNNTEYDIQCNVINGEGKSIKYNQKKYKRFSDHIGKFPVIIISPTDTNLILEGSEVRRKYLDSSIAQYKKSYLQILIRYNKTLKQRNSLLKQFSDKNFFDKDNLDIYDRQLIELGNIIHDERNAFFKKLKPVFNKYYSIISSSNEKVDLILNSQLNDTDYAKILKKSLEKDRYSNYTNCGVHKDDIFFHMDHMSIKKIGSQGQQKSFLIALKLAQFDFIKNEIGFNPILLLDDIFDKLDNNRVKMLISFVNNNIFGQVFITDTNKKRVEKILNNSNIEHTIFEIKEGKVANEKE